MVRSNLASVATKQRPICLTICPEEHADLCCRFLVCCGVPWGWQGQGGTHRTLQPGQTPLLQKHGSN